MTLRRAFRGAVVFLLAGCAKKEAPPPSPPAVDASVTAPSATPTATPSATATVSPKGDLVPTEATRTRTKRVAGDPALALATDAMTKHFGGRLPSELAVESVERSPGHGRALLVADATSPFASPFVFAVDAPGALAWTKDKPAAGILPPIGPLALGAGPSGRVSLAVCDPPTARVALRIWDHDGAPFADFDAMDIDDCTAISLLYWPRRGHVIVASRAGTTRAQLVSESGALAWRRGIDVGARTTTGAAASVAADSDDSIILVQYGSVSGEPGARPHALAFRYDLRGASLWTSPTDLGAAPASRVDDRIPLSRPRAGVVRATLARGVSVDVSSNGEKTLQRQ